MLQQDENRSRVPFEGATMPCEFCGKVCRQVSLTRKPVPGAEENVWLLIEYFCPQHGTRYKGRVLRP